MSASMYYDAFCSQVTLFKFYFDLVEEMSQETWLPKEVFQTIINNLRFISFWVC